MQPSPALSNTRLKATPSLQPPMLPPSPVSAVAQPRFHLAESVPLYVQRKQRMIHDKDREVAANQRLIQEVNEQTQGQFGVYFRKISPLLAFLPDVPAHLALQQDVFQLLGNFYQSNTLFFQKGSHQSLFNIAMAAMRQIFLRLGTLTLQKNAQLNTINYQTNMNPKETFDGFQNHIVEALDFLKKLEASLKDEFKTKKLSSQAIAKLLQKATDPLTQLTTIFRYLQTMNTSLDEGPWRLWICSLSSLYPAQDDIHVPKQLSLLPHLLRMVDHILLCSDPAFNAAINEIMKNHCPDISELLRDVRAYREKLMQFRSEAAALSQTNNMPYERWQALYVSWNAIHLLVKHRIERTITIEESASLTAPTYSASEEHEDPLAIYFHEFLAIGNTHNSINCAILFGLFISFNENYSLNPRILNQTANALKDLNILLETVQEDDYCHFFLSSKDEYLKGIYINPNEALLIEKFLDKAYRNLHQNTAVLIKRMANKWEAGYLDNLAERCKDLINERSAFKHMMLISDFCNNVTEELKAVAKEFDKNYTRMSIEDNLLTATIRKPLPALRHALIELHFWIDCCLWGPYELLTQLITELNPSVNPSITLVDTPLPLLLELASEPEPNNPDVIEVPPLLPPELPKIEEQPKLEAPPQPLAQPVKPVPKPKVKQEEPVMQKAPARPIPAAEPKGPDISSEKSRKLRNFIKLVQNYGFYLERKSKGSHFQYKHETSEVMVSIPKHTTIKLGTASAILDQIKEALKR